MLRSLATGGCALSSWRQVTGTTSMGYMNAEAWDFGAHGFLKRSHPCPGPGIQMGSRQVIEYSESKMRLGLKVMI